MVSLSDGAMTIEDAGAYYRQHYSTVGEYYAPGEEPTIGQALGEGAAALGLQGGISAEQFEALLRGLGCGLVPEPLARPQLEAGRLVDRATTRTPKPAELAYAWRAERGAVGLGRALQWWLAQLESPTTRRALLERHAGTLP
jgi:DNA-binding transcriptional LysR family regulator